jgi:hypothetical protein
MPRATLRKKAKPKMAPSPIRVHIPDMSVRISLRMSKHSRKRAQDIAIANDLEEATLMRYLLDAGLALALHHGLAAVIELRADLFKPAKSKDAVKKLLHA